MLLSRSLFRAALIAFAFVVSGAFSAGAEDAEPAGEPAAEPPASGASAPAAAPEGKAAAAPQPPEVKIVDATGLSDGYYIGEGQGHEAKIKVAVRVNNGKIRQVKVLIDDESRPRGAFRKLGLQIQKQNNTSVDAVSGATESSKGFIDAVEAALKGKPTDELPSRVELNNERKKSRAQRQKDKREARHKAQQEKAEKSDKDAKAGKTEDTAGADGAAAEAGTETGK